MKRLKVIALSSDLMLLVILSTDTAINRSLNGNLSVWSS